MEPIVNLPYLTQEAVFNFAVEAVKEDDHRNLSLLLPYLHPGNIPAIFNYALENGHDLMPFGGWVPLDAYAYVVEVVEKTESWPRGLDTHLAYMPLNVIGQLLKVRLSHEIKDFPIEKVFGSASRSDRDIFFRLAETTGDIDVAPLAPHLPEETLHHFAIHYANGELDHINAEGFIHFLKGKDLELVKRHMAKISKD